jgi:hypothetical protein
MTGPHAKGPPGNESRPGQGGHRDITDAHMVTDAADDSRNLVLYQVGYGTGYDVGYAHGWNACDDEWQAHMGVLVDVLNQPRHAELEAARQFTPGEPCNRKCRHCSKCVHAAAYRHRGWRDYPGDGAA